MDAGIRLAVAVVFVWVGMVLAISFVEVPLKFRAPGVTPRIGVGIGRLVFRALNVCEYVFVLIVAGALFTHETPVALNVVMLVAVAALLVQTIIVRPLLTRRTNALLQGGAVVEEDEEARSRSHFAYGALELVKVIALVWGGVLLIGL